MVDEETAAADAAGEVPDIETEARKMGWVPEEEWDSAKSPAPRAGFLSAEEFVKRGETVIPILNARNKGLEGKLASMEGQLKELSTTAQTLNDFNQRALERERRENERLKAELTSIREQAVADGDVGRFRQAEAQLKTLDETAPPEEGPGPQAQAVINQWVTANPWFEDPEMQAWAQGKANQLLARGYPKGVVLLEALAREAALNFPDRVAGGRGPRPGPVEGRGRRTEGTFGVHTYDDLPADAKAEFAKTAAKMKQELKVTLNRDTWTRDYWAQQD